MTIQDARQLVGRRLGFVDFDGSRAAYAALSPQQQEALSLEVIRYVIGNPDRFTSETVQAARIASSKQNFGTLGDYRNADLLDNATAFVKAYGETAGETIVGAADIAGQGARKLGINLGALVTVAAVAAILYFGAPFVIPRLREAFAKKPAAK